MKRSRKSSKPTVPYSERSPEELDAIADRFEQEFVPSKPLTPAMKRKHQKARSKLGRPPVGEGARQIRISLEGGLLRRTDLVAKKQNLSRSQLIAQGLRLRLARPASR